MSKKSIESLMGRIEFRRIIRFYLLEYPVVYNSGKRVSKSGEPFKDKKYTEGRWCSRRESKKIAITKERDIRTLQI